MLGRVARKVGSKAGSKVRSLRQRVRLRGKPRVLMLGTCRVFDPLEILELRGELRVLPRAWGYLHASSEALHMLELAAGERTPPPLAQAEMLNLPRLDTHLARMARDVDDADIAFVEVSSLKTYRIGEHATQVNSLMDATGIHAFEIDRWLRTGDREKLSDAQVEALADVVVGTESLEEMERNLSEVLDRLAGIPVVLVNHFVMAEPCHSALFVRKDIREVVAKVARKRDGVTWFDPTPMLEARGYPIMDSSHYEDAFKPVLADAFLELITDALG